MDSIDDLPLRASSHDIAEAAETAFKIAIDQCKLFIVQQQDRNDYGTDVQIEVREKNTMTNIRAHVQLKGTKTKKNKNGSVSISVDRSNLNYLLGQPNSIYVCYHLPSNCLYVRYADDVYREYEHNVSDWIHQQKVTVKFTKNFDENFQHNYHARLLVIGKSERDWRLKWIATPPENFSELVQNPSPKILVPEDPVLAKKLLAELYQQGKDSIISGLFLQLAAVLDPHSAAMDYAYLAEINLGINDMPFDKDRVKLGIKSLQKSLKRSGFEPGSIQYSLGNAWMALGDYEKARDTFKLALIQLNTPQLFSISAQCCKNLGSTLEKLGELDEARNFYEQALEFDPYLNAAHLALALWYRNIERYPHLSLEHLDRIVYQKGSEEQMATVQGWRIEMLFVSGDKNAAFREINSLLNKADQIDWIWPWCAKLVAQFGKTSVDAARKALLFWQNYLKKHTNHKSAERERLLCLWLLKSVKETTEISYEEFKASVTNLIENNDPDPAFMWDRLGHWSQFENDWVEAERAYRRAYKIDPERYGYCLGTALNFLKRHREALPILLPQAEEHKQDAMSWFQVAVACEGVNDIDGCIAAYKMALDKEENYDLAWFNLGGIYWDRKNMDLAKQTWREAVKRFPNHELSMKLRKELPQLFSKECDDKNE